jgi:hypothetical protein
VNIETQMPARVFGWKGIWLEGFSVGRVFGWKGIRLEGYSVESVFGWKGIRLEGVPTRVQIFVKCGAAAMSPGARARRHAATVRSAFAVADADAAVAPGAGGRHKDDASVCVSHRQHGFERARSVSNRVKLVGEPVPVLVQFHPDSDQTIHPACTMPVQWPPHTHAHPSVVLSPPSPPFQPLSLNRCGSWCDVIYQQSTQATPFPGAKLSNR